MGPYPIGIEEQSVFKVLVEESYKAKGLSQTAWDSPHPAFLRNFSKVSAYPVITSLFLRYL